MKFVLDVESMVYILGILSSSFLCIWFGVSSSLEFNIIYFIGLKF